MIIFHIVWNEAKGTEGPRVGRQLIKFLEQIVLWKCDVFLYLIRIQNQAWLLVGNVKGD